MMNIQWRNKEVHNMQWRKKEAYKVVTPNCLGDLKSANHGGTTRLDFRLTYKPNEVTVPAFEGSLLFFFETKKEAEEIIERIFKEGQIWRCRVAVGCKKVYPIDVDLWEFRELREADRWSELVKQWSHYYTSRFFTNGSMATPAIMLTERVK